MTCWMAFLGGVVLGMTLLFVAALCAVVCIIKEL